MKTMDYVLSAVCATLIAVCSWISVPTMVPFTLQTMAVFLVLELIGGKRGTLSILVYILLAAIGVPVLAGFSGGMGALLGMTGGYIVGFVFIGLTYWLSEVLCGGNRVVRIVAMIVGMAICYVFGTVWFMTVYAKQLGPISLKTALSWCVIPFLIPDAVKLVLAVTLGARLRKVLRIYEETNA
ncbi:MAG: biotin transporter BioY [Lachnospiraceae bacterium]|nr:biotin transporter BioY [Lachnospiraceae bacterium]